MLPEGKNRLVDVEVSRCVQIRSHIFFERGSFHLLDKTELKSIWATYLIARPLRQCRQPVPQSRIVRLL